MLFHIVPMKCSFLDSQLFPTLPFLIFCRINHRYDSTNLTCSWLNVRMANSGYGSLSVLWCLRERLERPEFWCLQESWGQSPTDAEGPLYFPNVCSGTENILYWEWEDKSVSLDLCCFISLHLQQKMSRGSLIQGTVGIIIQCLNVHQERVNSSEKNQTYLIPSDKKSNSV